MAEDKKVTISQRALKALDQNRKHLELKVSELEEELSKARNLIQSGKRSQRIEVPTSATAKKQKFEIGGTSGYIITGEYEDGSLGEIFLLLGKEGTLIKGLGDAFARSVSLGIQYGVPLKEFIKTFKDMEFFPNGPVSGVSGIKGAASVPDLLAKYVQQTYITKTQEKREAKQAEAIKEVVAAATKNGDIFSKCPECDNNTLKQKAMGCNNVCMSCGYIEVGGCG